jgi:hypothetical protein
MDGIDIARIHWTQEHPEAPLKMEILNHGDIEFDGALKGAPSRCAEIGSEAEGLDRNGHANDQIQQNDTRRDING